MDEDKYREIYHSINPLQCPFEKALNSKRCRCEKMERFNLADREGVACLQKNAWQTCRIFLPILRKSAVFALKISPLEDPLPHGKEIKVQNGSIIGLQKLFYPNTDISSAEPNIYHLLNKALLEYGQFEQLPLGKLIQSVVHFKARMPRGNKK